ncbi:transmembrane protein [Legionella beliardensis]|uniref:Transmembrane protein n=1 Tax=Legionella beliardensis TaxID=91822 RepID=A0A378HZD4_9GAMM|nr:Mpo1-like protein [Legionella beliardensis]STX28277.1 transmembrane protein [Legionella beliardensis]
MKSFIEQAQFYAEYHQKPITFYTHIIGVPLIIFSLMIFFSFFHIVVPGVMDIRISDVLTAFILIYYVILNWRLGLIVTPIFIFMVWIADLIGWSGPTKEALWTFVVFFVLGWVLQLIGHVIEGKRPALVDNFWSTLTAPLYLTAELFFKMGRMQDLKAQIHTEENLPYNTHDLDKKID